MSKAESLLLILLCIIFGFIFGFITGGSKIAGDCKTFGAFQAWDKVYTCQERK